MICVAVAYRNRMLAAYTLLALILATGCTYAFDNRPIVVLREDDVRNTWRIPLVGLGGISGLEYGKLKRIPITWGVVTDLSDCGYGLTYSELRDYMAVSGGEAASHSRRHAEELSDQAYIDELLASKATIEANLPGYSCRTFLQPGSWRGNANFDEFNKLNNTVGQALRTIYSQSLAYLGTCWRVGDVYYRHCMGNTFNIDYHEGATPASVIAVLDLVAETPGSIFIISCHGVQETGGTLTYHVQANTLKATMDKLAELRDQGRVRLMSLDDAYKAQFSPDLNRIPDPGFEHSRSVAGIPIGPWRYDGLTEIKISGGVGNSKYCLVSNTNTTAYANVLLPPGRYELRWWQRLEPDCPVHNYLRIALSMAEPKGQYIYALKSIPRYSVDPWTWEQHRAVAVINDSMSMTQVFFRAAVLGGIGIDNISIINAPIDPAVTPAIMAVKPHPSGCFVSWRTPDDPNINSMVVRYSANAHPLSPSEGLAFSTIGAIPGREQSASVAWTDWSTKNDLFFSVFAVKASGEFTEPDLAVVRVDKTPPISLSVTIGAWQDSRMNISLSAADPESGIWQYQYAVGRSPQNDDIVAWTSCGSHAEINLPPNSGRAYLSVKAQNPFGFYSIATKEINYSGNIAEALTLQDGTTVTISGVVTAVYGDSYYVQQAHRIRGIRVVGGQANCSEGSVVSVAGTITTIGGERAILANQ